MGRRNGRAVKDIALKQRLFIHKNTIDRTVNNDKIDKKINFHTFKQYF